MNCLKIMEIDRTFIKNLFQSSIIKVEKGNPIPLGNHFFFINNGMVSGKIGTKKNKPFFAKKGQFFCLKQLIDADEKVVSAVGETDIDLTIINYSELDKLLKGTDKNLSALIKSLISQGIY